MADHYTVSQEKFYTEHHRYMGCIERNEARDPRWEAFDGYAYSLGKFHGREAAIAAVLVEAEHLL